MCKKIDKENEKNGTYRKTLEQIFCKVQVEADFKKSESPEVGLAGIFFCCHI